MVSIFLAFKDLFKCSNSVYLSLKTSIERATTVVDNNHKEKQKNKNDWNRDYFYLKIPYLNIHDE